MAPITLYLWYDKKDKTDLGQLKEFIKNWESRQHFRTVIRTSFRKFSNGLHFGLI